MSGPDLGLAHLFTAGAPQAPVLLALHGTGSAPEQIAPLATELVPDAAVLAPAGPVSENGAARWFRRLREGVFDTDDVIARAGQLAEFVRRAAVQYELRDRRLIAVGFSNGANIAAALALLHPKVLDEAVLFSAMLPIPEPPRHDLRHSRIFLGSGENDPMAPLDSVRRLIGVLTERGAEVEVAWHPGGHGVAEDGLAAARTWLAGGGSTRPD